MKLTYLVILWLYCTLSFAQENKQRYEKVVDYITCICINDAAGKNKDCENEDFYNENDFNDKSSKNATYLLFQEFQELKKKNKNENDIINFLSVEIFTSDTYQKIKSFAESSKREKNIGTIRQTITNHLNSVYSEFKTESKQEDTINLSNPITVTSQTEKLETQKYSFFTLNFWTYLFILLFLVVVFFIYKLSNWISDIEKIAKKTEKKNDKLPDAQPDHQSINNYRRVEEKIAKLNDRLDKIELSKVEIIKSSIPEKRMAAITQPVKEASQTVVFYMATPDKEGYFNNSSEHNAFKQGATYYKFTTEENNKNKARFEFYSDDYGIKASANYPQTYLEPVCEAQNAQNPNAKKIVTLEEGVAQMQGDKWVVVKKAKINYE